jgi:hypothetical protein
LPKLAGQYNNKKTLSQALTDGRPLFWYGGLLDMRPLRLRGKVISRVMNQLIEGGLVAVVNKDVDEEET